MRVDLMMRDVFAWNEIEEHCLRHDSFTDAVLDLNADFTEEEIAAGWVIEEHADGFDAEGEPVTESRKWVPSIDRDPAFGDHLVWTTEGWR